MEVKRTPLSLDESVSALKRAMQEIRNRGGDERHILNALQICARYLEIAMGRGGDC
jgi:hypothetical protein